MNHTPPPQHTRRRWLAHSLQGLGACVVWGISGSATPLLARTSTARRDVGVGAVVRHLARLTEAAYADTLTAALALDEALQRLTQHPSAEHLAAARRAWVDARHWYGQTEVFRFSDGPIDDAQGPEPRINAWPLDEAFIDAVRERPLSGFINDPNVVLTRETLVALNTRGGETYISCGWHAIEFLLWGQDENPNGPGQRPYTDFVDGQAPHADRRRRALQLMSEQLLADLRDVHDAWRTDADNYRRGFEHGGLESLRRTLVGLGTLAQGELAGERLEVALATRQQEDEHSCFSDTTHRDILANTLGLVQVWRGQWRRRDGSDVTGPSLADLLGAHHRGLARDIGQRMTQILVAAQALQAPFDQEILRPAGQARVRALIQLLRAQARALLQTAHPLGLGQLNQPIPSHRASKFENK